MFVVTGPLFLPTPVVEQQQQQQQQQHGVEEVVNSRSHCVCFGTADDATIENGHRVGRRLASTTAEPPGKEYRNKRYEREPRAFGNECNRWPLSSLLRILSSRNSSSSKIKFVRLILTKRSAKKLSNGEMRYPLIGEAPELVAVPTHFFKVILVDEHANDPEKDVTLLGDVVDYNAPPKSAKVAAFVLPNAYIDPNTPLSNFAVPLESLEAVSGLTFFPKATNDLQTRDDIDRSERTVFTRTTRRRVEAKQQQQQQEYYKTLRRTIGRRTHQDFAHGFNIE